MKARSLRKISSEDVVPIGAAAPLDAHRLGQKGAGLSAMCRLGLPVPPGFTLTTALISALLDSLPPSALRADSDELDVRIAALLPELAPHLASLSAWSAERERPLVLAVRASPVVSMPGMLDTLLHVGLSDETLQALANFSHSLPFALDCKQRFLRQRGGAEAKGDVLTQLGRAIASVLRSSSLPRIHDYLRIAGLGEKLEMALIVQVMVYGNRGERSATGVLFTRDPSSGEPTLYGEFLSRAQGEDVVSGSHLPRPLDELSARLPAAFAELVASGRRLERHFGDIQDIEFTIEEGTLWLLQTRTAKRSGKAMVRVAVDLVREGVIDQAEALGRIEARRLGELLRPTIDASAARHPLTRGLPASPGVVSGKVVFHSADVESLARAGEPALLCRVDTSPQDILGIKLAVGLLTTRGGLTSHGAVVARGLGRCAVVGASLLHIDPVRQLLSTREHTVRRGEVLTIDGTTGEVLLGAVPLSALHLSADAHLQAVLSWTTARKLKVYSFAETATEWRLAAQLLFEGAIRVEGSDIAPRRLLWVGAADALPRRGLELSADSALDVLAQEPPDCEFVTLSADCDAGRLVDVVSRVRKRWPAVRLGLAATRLHNDEVDLVARAFSLGLDFVACPPIRMAIAAVAAAQLELKPR